MRALLLRLVERCSPPVRRSALRVMFRYPRTGVDRVVLALLAPTRPVGGLGRARERAPSIGVVVVDATGHEPAVVVAAALDGTARGRGARELWLVAGAAVTEVSRAGHLVDHVVVGADREGAVRDRLEALRGLVRVQSVVTLDTEAASGTVPPDSVG